MPPKANHRRRRPGPPPTGGSGSVSGDGAAESNVPDSATEVNNPLSAPRVSKAAAAAAASFKTESVENSELMCPVCASACTSVAVGDCGHGVCETCSHRLRFLYKRRTCVLCNAVNEEVAVVSASKYVAGETNYSSIVEAAKRGGVDLGHDPVTDMVFTDPAVRERLMLVAGFTCPRHVGVQSTEAESIDPPRPVANNPKKSQKGKGRRAVAHESGEACNHLGKEPCLSHKKCTATFRNMKLLQNHAREVHRAVFCGVCVDANVEYVSKLPLYPLDGGRQNGRSSLLAEHMKKEHRLCRFCNWQAVDDDALYEHLQKHHESCHLCERAGRMHEYFRNFNALDAHYRENHHVCPEPGCRGVVFGSILDLQAHMLQRHRNSIPHSTGRRRFQVDLSELHSSSRTGGSSGRGSHGARYGPVTATQVTATAPPPLDSEEDVRQEQERQAARRRGFLASSVVFSSNSSTVASTGENNAGVVESGRTTPHGNGANVAGRSSVRGSARARDQSARSFSTANPLNPQGSDRGATNASAASQIPDEDFFCERRLPECRDESAARNKALVALMRATVDPAEFEQFRSMSGDFRRLRISADEYYGAAIDAFGMRRAMRDILPELVALLPNPDLRASLVSVCLRLNPPPASIQTTGSTAGSTQVSRTALARTDNLEVSQNSFPALEGAQVPRTGRPAPRVVAREDQFPRLGGAIASRTAETSDMSTSRSRARASDRTSSSVASGGMQPSVTRMFGTGPTPGPQRPVPAPTTSFPALTASLRPQASRPHHHAGPAEARVVTTNMGAFPALSGGNSSTGTAVDQSSEDAAKRSVHEGSASGSAGNPTPGLAPDVSDRAGAVWGEASASRAYGKKRGPGRGSVPAPAPDLSAKPSAPPVFPALGASNRPQAGGRSGRSDVAGASSKPVVLDMSAVAMSRHTQSALPRVAQTSGYGFSWERKKMRNKQREVKREVNNMQSSAASKGSGSASSASSGSVLQQVSNSSIPTVTSNVVASAASASQASQVDGAATEKANDSAQKDASSNFDQFSYLTTNSRSGEDPTSAFFGN